MYRTILKILICFRQTMIQVFIASSFSTSNSRSEWKILSIFNQCCSTLWFFLLSKLITSWVFGLVAIDQLHFSETKLTAFSNEISKVNCVFRHRVCRHVPSKTRSSYLIQFYYHDVWPYSRLPNYVEISTFIQDSAYGNSGRTPFRPLRTLNFG